MLKPKVLILRTAGTNCDAETDTAFQLAGAETALIHIQNLISEKVDLTDYQILAIPGGFSYGDDISAGILLAVEMKHKLTNALNRFVADGKLILGICNGFQVLVRTGLLPGINISGSSRPEMMQQNDSGNEHLSEIRVSMGKLGKRRKYMCFHRRHQRSHLPPRRTCRGAVYCSVRCAGSIRI